MTAKVTYDFIDNITLNTRAITLTVRCWNSQAFMMFVAALGKIPLFFWLFLPWSSSAVSLPPSSDPIEALRDCPIMKEKVQRQPEMLTV